MRTYFNNRIAYDYAGSLLIALIIVFEAYIPLHLFQWPSAETVPAMALSIAASSASLLGFVLAANTFLISHTQHRRLSLLRKSAGFAQLLDIMKSSLWRLFILTLIAGAGALTAPIHLHAVLIVIAFMISLSGLALAALIWATMSILAIPLD